MKTVILSGFLGAGKTTFLKSLLKRLENAVVLENDYARANIDTELLKSENLEIVSMEEGCICCSKGGDFASSVLTIANTLRPDYLIIEPTGLGFLSRVVENIKKVEYEGIEILNPITVVDYQNIESTMKDYRDLFVDQVANAGHIIISKAETVPDSQIRERIKNFEDLTDAEIHIRHYSTFDDSQWRALIETSHEYALKTYAERGMNIETLSYRNVEFHDFHTLGTNINAICQGRFGKVLRGKGLIRVAGQNAKLDIVQGNFTIEPYGPIEKTELVFIGEGLEKKAFDTLLGRSKKKFSARRGKSLK